MDPAQPIPLYFQLKTLLLEEILQGRYGPDARLPTEHELCEQHAISRTPVSRALSELAEEGVILRHRRRGSFVNPHWLNRRPDQPEIRIVVTTGGPWAAMLRAAAEADTGQANVVAVPLESLHATLTRAVAEGRAPDLAILDSVWAPEFAVAGFLHALEELDAEWVRTEHEVDFLPALVAANRYDGQTFGVSAFADVAGLWYRRDELDRRGLAPPTTWSELRDMARALASHARPHPVAIAGGSKGGETTAYCLIAFLASNGAAVLGPEGVELSSGATARALRFLRSLVDEGLMSVDVVGYDWNQPVRLLAERQAALILGGSYEAQVLAETLGVAHREIWNQFAFTDVPAGPNGAPASVTGGMMFGVFKQAARPELAMRLLRRALAPDALAAIARRTGRIPGRRSAVELAAPDLPYLSQTAAMLEHAVNRPWLPSYPRVSAQLGTMLEAVLTGRLSPAVAARRTAEFVGAITGLPLVPDPGPVESRRRPAPASTTR